MHGQGGDVAAIKDNFAAIGTHQTDDHVETGGFAGTIGAEQSDDLAGIQAEAEVVYHLPRAVALAQSLRDQPQPPACFVVLSFWRIFIWLPPPLPPLSRSPLGSL